MRDEEGEEEEEEEVVVHFSLGEDKRSEDKNRQGRQF